MELKRYAEAVKIFHHIIEIEDGRTSAYTYQSLGHSYLLMNMIPDAIKWLSKADEIYQIDLQKKQRSSYHDLYREFLDIYCYALTKDGKKELAKSIKAKYEGLN